MHAQVVTYRLDDVISDDKFIEANKEFAEAMAEVPGLIAKVWLKGTADGGYGGLYLWEDEAAYQGFVAGELWTQALNDASLIDLTSRDYAVMADLTRMTQPGMEVRRGAPAA
jgi:hypothetical protein